MKTTESTPLPNDDINVVITNSRKKPPKNESARGGGGQTSAECRYLRGRNNCPAFGKSCSTCSKMNHFAVKCLSPRKSPINALPANEGEISDEDMIETALLHEEKGNFMHVTAQTLERFLLQ